MSLGYTVRYVGEGTFLVGHYPDGIGGVEAWKAESTHRTLAEAGARARCLNSINCDEEVSRAIHPAIVWSLIFVAVAAWLQWLFSHPIS